MSKKQPAKLPPALSAARRQIDQWRRRGRQRGRMPEALWRRAATLAGKYGLNPTARALKLNYYSLKKHLAERAPKKVIPAQAASDFIELLPNVMTPGAVECRIEWIDSGGATVRMHIQGANLSELTSLASVFRGGQV